MARNLKKDYIIKLVKMEVPNGYKFDLANYLHNPAAGYDYPSFIKKIEEDDKTITMRRVYYIKYFDGSGAYKEETYCINKDEHDSWVIIHNSIEKKLEESNRFNIKKLLTFCE